MNQEHVKAYLEFLERNRRLTKGALASHRRHLKRLGALLGKTPIEAISLQAIDRATRTLLKTLEPSTANHVLGHWRSFARWLRKRRYIAGVYIPLADGLETVPMKKKHREVMSMAGIVAAIRKIEKQAKHVSIVLWTQFITGARPKALFDAKWKDVHLPKRGMPGMIILDPLKKGSSATTIIQPGSLLEKVLLEAKELYRQFHRNDPNSRGRYPTKKTVVFPTVHGRSKINPGGWTTESFGEAVRRLSSGKFNAYQIRHSVGTWLQLQGANAHQIKSYMRHRNLRTQEAYAHDAGVEAVVAQNMIEQAIRDES